MNKHTKVEPFFITEAVEADMRAAGHAFDPPKHVSTIRLSEVLASLSDADLASWPTSISQHEREKRQANQMQFLAAKDS